MAVIGTAIPAQNPTARFLKRLSLTPGAGVSAPVSNLKVATFGDSFSAVKSLAAGANYADQSIADRELNATTQVGVLSTSKYLLYESYPAAQLEIDCGISGQTTTQMIARSGLSASPSRRAIEDCLALSPYLILARCGSINDIVGFTSSTPSASVDAVFTRHMQIISGLASGGAYVLDEGIAGYSVAGANLAAIQAILVDLNGRYAAAIAALNNPKIRFLNPIGLTCNAGGAFLTNYSTDGTHLNTYGARIQGKAEGALLSSWIGPSDVTAFPGPNLIAAVADYPDPVSGVFGLVPQSAHFSWGAMNGTRQNATIETIDGVKYAICELNPTGASPSLVFNCLLMATLFTPGLAVPGDVVSIEADIFVDGAGLPIGWNGLTTRLRMGASATDRIIYDLSPNTTPSTAVETAIRGRISLGKIKIPSASGTFIAGQTDMTITCAANSGNVLRMGVGNVRVVKL